MKALLIRVIFAISLGAGIGYFLVLATEPETQDSPYYDNVFEVAEDTADWGAIYTSADWSLATDETVLMADGGFEYQRATKILIANSRNDTLTIDFGGDSLTVYGNLPHDEAAEIFFEALQYYRINWCDRQHSGGGSD